MFREREREGPLFFFQYILAAVPEPQVSWPNIKEEPGRGDDKFRRHRGVHGLLSSNSKPFSSRLWRLWRLLIPLSVSGSPSVSVSAYLSAGHYGQSSWGVCWYQAPPCGQADFQNFTHHTWYAVIGFNIAKSRLINRGGGNKPVLPLWANIIVSQIYIFRNTSLHLGDQVLEFPHSILHPCFAWCHRWCGIQP